MKSIWSSIPALIVIGAVLIPLGVYALLGVGEKLLTGLSSARAGRWRPWLWLWLAMPLLIVGVILIYPLVVTILYAFRNAKSVDWVGVKNFTWSFSGDMVGVISNRWDSRLLGRTVPEQAGGLRFELMINSGLFCGSHKHQKGSAA